MSLRLCQARLAWQFPFSGSNPLHHSWARWPVIIWRTGVLPWFVQGASTSKTVLPAEQVKTNGLGVFLRRGPDHQVAIPGGVWPIESEAMKWMPET